MPEVLAQLNRAGAYLSALGGPLVEVLLIDNASTDRTRAVALDAGTAVLSEPVRNIAKVRNTGAKAAQGGSLVFIDADTLVPEALLWRISQIMADPSCIGGAVDTEYHPARLLVKHYLQTWRVLGRAARMAQGATQFYRRDAFLSIGGYDEGMCVGEEVDLFWRLKRLAKREGRQVVLLRDLRVIPSCRRFDSWPFWRTLLWTNPLLIALCRRQQAAWHGW